MFRDLDTHYCSVELPGILGLCITIDWYLLVDFAFFTGVSIREAVRQTLPCDMCFSWIEEDEGQ